MNGWVWNAVMLILNNINTPDDDVSRFVREAPQGSSFWHVLAQLQQTRCTCTWQAIYKIDQQYRMQY